MQIINPHYPRRAHSVFDNVGWLRDAWKNPVFLSTQDAAAAGLEDGEAVLITTAYGQCVRNAYVTERVRPGVVALPHGAWVDVDGATGIDYAGADNYLTGQVPNGQGVSGYNSATCRIEKYKGARLVADVDIATRVPQEEGAR